MSAEIPLSLPLGEQLDAVLVHAYGYNEREPEHLDRIDRPNLRARVSIAALEQLLENYDVKNVVFTSEHIFGEDRPPVGIVTANEAMRKFHLEERGIAVHVLTNRKQTILGLFHRMVSVKDTSGESIAFLQLAKEREWNRKRTLSLGSETHLGTIQQIYDHRREAVSVVSSENVLINLPSERNAGRFAKIIDVMHRTLEEKRFKKQEKIKKLIYSIPGGELALRTYAGLLRKKPDLEAAT